MITPMKSSTTKKDVSKVRLSSSLFRKSSPDPSMRRWMACGYFPPSQHATTDPVVHGEEGGRKGEREENKKWIWRITVWESCISEILSDLYTGSDFLEEEEGSQFCILLIQSLLCITDLLFLLLLEVDLNSILKN
jgi:hypothetical protein